MKNLNEYKQDILGINYRYTKSIFDEAQNLILAVCQNGNGFPKEVANTVYKYKKASEKQAYIIAKAIIEQDCLTIK